MNLSFAEILTIWDNQGILNNFNEVQRINYAINFTCHHCKNYSLAQFFHVTIKLQDESNN